MMRSKLLIFLFFFISVSPALGQGVSLEKISREELCKSANLYASPGIKYLYTYHLYNSISFFDVNCLDVKKDCRAVRVSGINFPANFTIRDAEFQHVSIWGDIQTYKIDEMVDATGQIDAPVTHKIPVPKEMMSYVWLAPSEDDYVDITKYYDRAKIAIDEISKFKTERIGPYGRDIHGFFRNNKLTILKVDDKFDVFTDVAGRLNLIDGNGFVYLPDLNQVQLKLTVEGKMVIGVSGGVLLYDGNGQVKSKTGSGHLKLIEGDDKVAYIGTFQSDGVISSDIPTGLVDSLRLKHVKIKSAHYSKQTQALMINYLAGLDGEGRPSYGVKIARPNEVAEFNCHPSTPLHYEVVKGSNADSPLWIERYALERSKRTVSYFPGGPLGYGDDSEPIQKSMLLSGYSVDVVNYSGSMFTYESATRLRKNAYAALGKDGVQFSELAIKLYPKGDMRPALVMSSFGAQFYQFLDPDVIRSYGVTILDYPGGSESNGFNRDEPFIANLYRRVVGDEFYAKRGFTNYYKTLSRCPLISPTTILYGRTDEVAPVKKDYALCRNDPQVRFIGFDGGHYGRPKESIPRLISVLDEKLGGIRAPAN